MYFVLNLFWKFYTAHTGYAIVIITANYVNGITETMPLNKHGA